MRRLWKLRALWMVVAGTCLGSPCFGQSSSVSEGTEIRLSSVADSAICSESMPANAVKAALRLVCLRNSSGIRNMAVEKAIIIGFVGGFVRSDDKKHPEVQFAAHLRKAYPSAVHAEVFSNHDGKRALRRVLQLLSEDGNGVPTSLEKEKARVIIYGHSWGASQTVTLARELGRRGIPVVLTIQIDSVRKPGQNDYTIPANVRNAINFYQTKGLIHGRQTIRAADPELTNVLGNVEMTYRNHDINTDNYPWLARHLNRGHHEIENDPVVWDQIGSLIDSELSTTTSLVQVSLPSPRLPSN